MKNLRESLMKKRKYLGCRPISEIVKVTGEEKSRLRAKFASVMQNLNRLSAQLATEEVTEKHSAVELKLFKLGSLFYCAGLASITVRIRVSCFERTLMFAISLQSILR